jgi:hypothetical protein
MQYTVSMAAPFSRSLRSLQQDNSGLSLTGLIITLVLLFAWGAWFFLARITVYESSREFQVQRDGSLQVTFAPSALVQIQAGQKARLRLANGRAYAAIVLDSPDLEHGSTQVPVFVYAADNLQPGRSGEVQVEVEHISPADLVLRSAGQLSTSARLLGFGK